MRVDRRIVVFGAALSALVPPIAGLANGPTGELLMFETADCPWCRAWHRDIGAIYPKTAEAARFPLRRIDMTKPRPAELRSVDGIRFSPTFVVRLNGRELGRIVGYPGEDQFWGALEAIVARAATERREESIL
jgi:thioredoxin-related protein